MVGHRTPLPEHKPKLSEYRGSGRIGHDRASTEWKALTWSYWPEALATLGPMSVSHSWRWARCRRGRQPLQQQRSVSRTCTNHLRTIARLSTCRRLQWRGNLRDTARLRSDRRYSPRGAQGGRRFQRSAHDLLREQRLGNDAACVSYDESKREDASFLVRPRPFMELPRTCRWTRSIPSDRQIRTAAQSFSSKKY
jgi:hypothetical protein